MTIRSTWLLFAVVAAGVAAAQPVTPSNLLVDPAKPQKTIWPYPKRNSGTIEYRDHRQDLSRWPSLSYEDKRPTAKVQVVQMQGAANGDAARGKAIAMNTQAGNCWACHVLPGDPQGGTVGPPLLDIGRRGYTDAYMYQQIWDRRATNPETVMPPYGTHGVLNDQQVRDLVAFLQSIK